MWGFKNVFSKARKIDDTPPFTVPTKFERTNKTSTKPPPNVKYTWIANEINIECTG
jgi:hypothetical protein